MPPNYFTTPLTNKSFLIYLLIATVLRDSSTQSENHFINPKKKNQIPQHFHGSFDYFKLILKGDNVLMGAQ